MKTLYAITAALLAASAMPADAALVGLYTFNSAGTLGKDSSGNGNDLIAYGAGATYTANGASGGGLSLDGASYLSTTDQLAPLLFPIGSSAYTLSVTFKTTSSNAAQSLLGWGAYGNYDQTNAIRTDGPNGIVNYWWDNDLRGNTPAALNDGQFHTVTANYDGTVRNLYLDGLLIGSNRPVAPNVQRGNFAIGLADAFNGQPYLGDDHFTGTLDNVAIFNTAQTPDQVSAAIATAAVPEPATWAMMLLGFGGLGYAMRRRPKAGARVRFA